MQLLEVWITGSNVTTYFISYLRLILSLWICKVKCLSLGTNQVANISCVIECDKTQCRKASCFQFSTNLENPNFSSICQWKQHFRQQQAERPAHLVWCQILSRDRTKKSQKATWEKAWPGLHLSHHESNAFLISPNRRIDDQVSKKNTI